MSLTEEQKRERKKLYNKRYRSTENGKLKTRESTLKYQQGESYKQQKREYYLKKRAELVNDE